MSSKYSNNESGKRRPPRPARPAWYGRAADPLPPPLPWGYYLLWAIWSVLVIGIGLFLLAQASHI